MKKAVCLCMTTAIAFSLLAGSAVSVSAVAAPATATAPIASTEENCFSDSWKQAASPELTDTVRNLFDRAFDGLVGAVYTPVALLATRTTTSGTQYRILCKMTIVVPDAQEQYTVVTLNRGWLGKAEILEFGEALCPTDLADAPLAGGWQEAASPVLTEDAAAAFHKAADTLLGVAYTPLALLSTQVVAGTNYRILCEAVTVYPGAEPYYVVVTVYEDLAGNASILNVSDSLTSPMQ